MGRNRTVCDEHATTNPCGSCAADHKVGDHDGSPRPATCRMCRSDARPPRSAPETPAPNPRRLVDVAALAAHDDTLTHLTEV